MPDSVQKHAILYWREGGWGRSWEGGGAAVPNLGYTIGLPRVRGWLDEAKVTCNGAIMLSHCVAHEGEHVPSNIKKTHSFKVNIQRHYSKIAMISPRCNG